MEDIRKVCPKAEVENPIAFYGNSVNLQMAKSKNGLEDVINEV